jgi:hypothetical protein
MILPLLIVLLVRWGWRQNGTARWCILVPGALLGMIAIAGMVGTCSRGGVLALLVACGLLALLVAGVGRRLVVVTVLALVVALAVVPRAGGRMATDPTRDQSIACRLSLMKASAMMIADRPAGWGTGRFGNVCERWYLDRFRGVHLWHPINDALWLGTERGLLVMGVFFALSLALIAALAQRGHGGDPLAAGLAAAGLAFLVAGTTTALLWSSGIAWTMAGFAVVAVGHLAFHVRHLTKSIWHWTITGAGLGLLMTASWWAFGVHAAATWPYRPAINADPVAVVPRSSPQAMIVAVVRADEDTATVICRQVLRPLVDVGFAAVCLAESELAAWPDRGKPHLLLVLRGAVKDTSRIIMPGTMGAAFLDLPESGLTTLAPSCPVLLVTGSAQTSVSAETWEAVVKTQAASRAIAAPVPCCWPRHFSKMAEQVGAWFRVIVLKPIACQ